MTGRLHGPALALTLLAGCSQPAFVCESDVACLDAGGLCEPEGYCSFPDDGCSSGRRFGTHAGGGLAGQCVADGGSTGSSSTSTGTTTSDATSTTTDDGSTGIVAICGNGDVEGEEDCDDGNDRDGDGCNADCTASGQLRWATLIDVGAADDKVYSVAEDPTGELVAAGYSQAEDGNNRWLTVRLDAQGQELSTEIVDETNSSYSLGLAFDAEGVRVEAGELTVDPAAEINTGIIRRFDGSGWTWQMPTDMDCSGRLDDIEVGADGTLYAAGVQTCSGRSSPYLVAIDPGASEPTWEFAGDSVDGGIGQQLGVAFDGSGVFVLGGMTQADATTDSDVVVYAVSEMGTELWRGTYAGEGTTDDRAGPVAVLADFAVLTAGAHTPSSTEAWIGRFEPPEASPTMTWTDAGDGLGDQSVHALLALPDGGFVMAGRLNMAQTQDDAVIARYDSTGAIVWRDVRDFDGDLDRLFDLDLAADGDILAAGYSRDLAGVSRCLVMRYSP